MKNITASFVICTTHFVKLWDHDMVYDFLVLRCFDHTQGHHIFYGNEIRGRKIPVALNLYGLMHNKKLFKVGEAYGHLIGC